MYDIGGIAMTEKIAESKKLDNSKLTRLKLILKLVLKLRLKLRLKSKLILRGMNI